jgi:glutathione S-transferase
MQDMLADNGVFFQERKWQSESWFHHERRISMKLHVFSAATTSRAVLAFCHAQGIHPEIVEVNLMEGEHHNPEFAALNPNRMVPLLEDGDFVLSEASAILRYLARKTESPLYPKDLQDRARIDEMMAWFESNFYRDFGAQYIYPQLMPHHKRETDEVNAGTIRWGRDQSKRWLEILDTHYLAGGKNFLVGDKLSIADLLGASILSLGDLVKCSLDAYPNVRHWYHGIRGHESWSAINGSFAGFAESLGSASFVAL